MPYGDGGRHRGSATSGRVERDDVRLSMVNGRQGAEVPLDLFQTGR